MLDLFFRKYAWIANALLLVAAAWIAARTVNTVLGEFIRPAPEVDLSAQPPAAPMPLAKATLSNDQVYALFGQTAPKPAELAGEPDAPPTPKNCDDARAAAVKTSLRLQLVAAVISERPRWSIVSIADPPGGDTQIYGVGDRVQGAELLSVAQIPDPRDETGHGFEVAAILCNGGQKEYLDFDMGGTSASSAAAGSFAPSPVAGAGGPNYAAIRNVGANRYEIPRSVLERSLANLNDIATQARIVPSFRNGVANGFKLFSVQPNSLYAAIGIKNGDVIQRINGYEINSPDKALEVYQKLRESSHITIQGDRNNQQFSFDYDVTGQ